MLVGSGSDVLCQAFRFGHSLVLYRRDEFSALRRYCMADQEDIALMGHLLRRAGFGASRAEIEAKAAQGYNAVVEELLNPETQPALEDDIVLRYNPVYNHSANIQTNVQQWVYWMINNPRQLQEKMSLFWHMIFCAG